MSSDRSREPERPTPDELLDRYQLRDSAPVAPSDSSDSLSDVEAPGSADSHTPRKGRLRVYLGMAAGVGKTYDMLNEGRRRKARGTDVVIGYVETHGRALTEQQIGDLEVVPRQRITYKGVTLEEMDTDAIIARHPQVALID